jgi:hypothetical protein
MDPRSRFVEFFVFCPPPPPTPLAVVDIDEGLLLGGAGCAFLGVVAAAPPLLAVEDNITAAVAPSMLPNAGIDYGRGRLAPSTTFLRLFATAISSTSSSSPRPLLN